MKIVLLICFVYLLSCDSPKNVNVEAVPVMDSVATNKTKAEASENKKTEPVSQPESSVAWPSLPSTQIEVAIKVDGMSCQGCADSAAELATKIEGVMLAKGSFEKGEIVVRYEKGKTDGQEIADTIAGTKLEGYPQLKTSLVP